MRLLLTVPALVFAANCALAADNLECQGPFGELADTPKFTIPAGHLDPKQDGMTCPPIPSDRAVAAVECLVRVTAPPKPEAVFRCPLNAPCPGVGTFKEVERVRGPMGLDQLCATFTNESGHAVTFGIRATLTR